MNIHKGGDNTQSLKARMGRQKHEHTEKMRELPMKMFSNDRSASVIRAVPRVPAVSGVRGKRGVG